MALGNFGNDSKWITANGRFVDSEVRYCESAITESPPTRSTYLVPLNAPATFLSFEADIDSSSFVILGLFVDIMMIEL